VKRHTIEILLLQRSIQPCAEYLRKLPAFLVIWPHTCIPVAGGTEVSRKQSVAVRTPSHVVIVLSVTGF
jgi:hypothetical protein